MDYKEKYEMALEGIQEVLSSGEDSIKMSRLRLRLQGIFPELKESEDEKIRKKLISFVENWDKGGIVSKYTSNANDIKRILAWLEKQGEKPQGKSALEAINEEKVDDANKVEPKDYNSIDPHFGKPADKIEPNFNFNVGQWIVATGKCVYLITKIDGFNVTLVDVHGDEYVFDASSLDNAHLWSIRDAKDGDVLAAHECTVLFKEIDGLNIKCHCTYHFMNNPSFYVNTLQNKSAFHPATKEQRDTLMKAMADAGYTFNFESKELKKLSQSEVTKMSDQEEIAEIPFGAKDSELQEATYYIPEGFHAEIDDDKVVIKKGEKPTAWSDEDERNIQNIDAVLFYDKTLPEDTYVKLRNFLKSLKQRIGG